MDGLHCLVSGKVQGVSYRWFVKCAAEQLGLVGWVRNLDDGRVECKFFGQPSALEAMLTQLGLGPAYANVTSVESEPALSHEFNDFEILPTAASASLGESS